MANRKPKGRDVNGILLLDKALGISSNHALQQVKRLFHANKVGHTGSLDPLASGLLPLCLGEATKLSGFLLDADKTYEGVCRLGIRTTTADAEGDVIEEKPIPEMTDAQLRLILEKFTGEITQIPPMHSAIKVQGQPLYKLAHQGIEIERQPRKVMVYEFNLLSRSQSEFGFSLRCSKGTYVRTLVEDIGILIGCGAFLAQLRRTAVGPFDLVHAHSMDQLAAVAEQGGMDALDKLILPMENALTHWPAIQLTENSTFYVRQGQPVQVARAPTTGWVRLFAADTRFLGVGEILDDGRIAPRRLVNVRG